MLVIAEEDYLAHHGVKGMKWGVRHERKNKGLSKRAKKKLDKKTGKYMSVGRSYSKNKNRFKAWIKYQRAFLDLVLETAEKRGIDRNSLFDDYGRFKGDPGEFVGQAALKKLAKSFVDEYAEAALADLKIKSNYSEAKEFIKEKFNDQIDRG